jgi:hypothetical protein
MQGLLKSDIFFVVTTFAVIFVSLALLVALVYIIRILKDMKILSRKARDEGEKILEDVAEFREDAKVKGASLSKFFAFLGFPKKKKGKYRDADVD